MSNSDEPEKKPPPVSSGSAPTQRLPVQPETGDGGPGGSAPAAPPAVTTPTPDAPPADPNATVRFSAADVAKLVEEEAAAAQEADQQEDRLIGTLLRDKWKVLKRLGAGSFGTVYKVQDVKGEWIEALKILGVDRMTGAEAEEMRARFLREAQIMKRLGKDSKHIVGLSTYEEDIEAGMVYFLMEFVEGPSLAAALAKDGPFTVERTVRIALQACDALMAAHEGPEPVVHRDLKLENLMLATDRSGQEMVKVLDFGIAKIAEREADSRLTTVGTLGTPGYAAPEQLRAEAVDGRTDLFAFGVILYALLTGRDPWLGNLAHEPTHQIYELMVATDRADVRPINESGVSIPPAMVNVVMKLLRRDPDQRFQSARSLRDALTTISQGRDFSDATPETSAHDTKGSSTPSVRSQPSRPRPAPRKKSGAGRLAAAIVVLAALGATAWAQPWGRTLDSDSLLAMVRGGSVSQVWLTDGGIEGGIQVVPVDALAEVKTPFFASVDEGDVPDVVARLRDSGATVDVSWEARRLTGLAIEAQARNRYFGVDGGDVRSYALRVVELVPDSPEAASLLLKVGERMAWDAEAARTDGTEEQAAQLVQQCLELVPEHPRCLEVSGGL